MSNNPAQLPNLIITRFSFLGQSGWKIPPEDRHAVLFDPTRIDLRLWLFEKIALASLRAQTDQNFHHYILTSDALPDWALARLTQICTAAYPADRFTIDRQPTGNARKYLRQFIQKRFATRVVQIVLDDDDGLAIDFTATLAAELAKAEAQGQLTPDSPPFYLSFSRGYGLVFPEDGSRQPSVYLHKFPYINLGLTLVAKPDAPNILAIDHKNAPKRSGCVPIEGPPMFVRSVHGFNDSRVTATARWKDVPAGLNDPALLQRFPFLANLP